MLLQAAADRSGSDRNWFYQSVGQYQIPQNLLRHSQSSGSHRLIDSLMNGSVTHTGHGQLLTPL
jgi:hypothetical protein